MITKENIQWIQWLEVGGTASRNEIIYFLFNMENIGAQLEISIYGKDEEQQKQKFIKVSKSLKRMIYFDP